MLINLCNHESTKWNEVQQKKAVEMFISVTDIPFPEVPPEADLQQVKDIAFKYEKNINEIIARSKDSINAVHLMGEFTFTYQMIELLRAKNIPVFASTNTREVFYDEKGNKVSVFKFVSFRKYF